MALEREAYKALEDIVGPEYITEEPAVLDGYCFVWGNEVIFGDRFSPRPLAVVMPGSVEEIQAIVRACNRYGVKFRAHATGWEVTALSAPEGFLSVDLRRMNRILEIDERNMYAVVEPYVSIGALTLEAIKKGLRGYSLGAGPSASVIASSTSHGGMGNASISTGLGGRCPLGVEWVLPTGEILRLGSLGTGAGWFTGDGPGPSLRGIMRGVMGANGGLGIFTKAAVKLSPWYGPSKIETKGGPPSYEVEVPKNFKVYTFTFPSREKVIDALYLISEEGIAHVCSRRGPYAVVSGLVGSNEELWELWRKGYYQEKCAHSIVLIIDASSSREMDYKVNVLQEIVRKTDGEEFPEDPRLQAGKFAHGLIAIGAVRGTFRAGGTFWEGPSGEESLDSLRRVEELGSELKEKYAKAGKLLDDGDPTWIQPYEAGSVGGHGEIPVRFDPCDPEAVKAAAELASVSNKLLLEQKLGTGLFEGGLDYRDEIHDSAGPKCLNYHIWMRKIKKTFDPNLVSESSFYTTPKE